MGSSFEGEPAPRTVRSTRGLDPVFFVIAHAVHLAFDDAFNVVHMAYLVNGREWPTDHSHTATTSCNRR